MSGPAVRSGVVSTVITVYNRPRLLAEAVNSVLAQTYRPIEIVIVDDGSTDESGAVGRSFESLHPGVVRYAHQTNGGPASASNHGLRLITGEFVQFLDSDDVIMPEKFALQVEGLRAEPACGISYCYAREYPLGQPWSGFPSRRTGQTFERLFPAVLSGKIWPTPAPLYRRSVVVDNGPFLDVSIHQDWEYECRAAARDVRLHHVRAYLADLRGAHHLEGRKKGGASGRKLTEVAGVLEAVLAHARTADVPHRDLDTLSRQFFINARKCAAAGYQAESRRCLSIGIQTANARRRARIILFEAAAHRIGWQRAGRWSERLEHGPAAEALRTVRRHTRMFGARWRHRLKEGLAATSGQPLDTWPGLLWRRWQQRQSRVRARA
jgi:hypothetical protein